MARHLLDWWTTKCSCKWWWCKVCNASNKIVSLHNDLIKFWLSKETIKENLQAINAYLDKIDTFTLYEYYSNQITEEQFNEALEKFKPGKRRAPVVKKSETEWFKPTPNPETAHKWNWSSPWSRCEYCWCIRKYCEKEECSSHKLDENE